LRSAIIAVIALTVQVVLAETPEEAFENLLDAVYEGNADEIAEHLSSETMAMLDLVVAMIKLQPGEAASEFSQELGSELSAEDILGWTSTDFIDAVILSPGFIEELPSRDEITISHFEINGDSSTVFLTVSGISQPFGMAMTREGDTWKLSENLIQSPLL
jgi:hypothetical protein